jgi:2-C-methyl-D-erythritol 2,4-cyclodiphosphate synthase
LNFRIGHGFDVHALKPGRSFILGGIKIKSDVGPVGHSDADVLIHAICDALLGAAALGDIGLHFPDNSEAYKNIDSKILLQKVVDILKEKNYAIVNIDTTVVLEKPKIAPYIPAMREALSVVMNIPAGDISIKATTNEKMGYVGREEGICAFAVALIQLRAKS